MTRTLLVFPSDSLQAYVRKGEVKRRYFNPGNIFSRVIVANPSTEELTLHERELLQIAFGNADVEILNTRASSLPLGPFGILEARGLLRRIPSQSIDCVRAFGLWQEGALARWCARRLGVPYVTSVHTNYDDYRHQVRLSGAVVRATAMRCLRPVERTVLRDADFVICVYEYARKYALNNGASRARSSVIHNKVFRDQFYPSTTCHPAPYLRVINVSNMNWFKNQQVLIRAVAMLQGQVRLTLVGQGPDLEANIRLTKELGVDEHITFIPRIENASLRDEYVKHDVFAHPIRVGGVGIPVLEAMACGLGILHARYPDERKPEILMEAAKRIPCTPKAFAAALEKIHNDRTLLATMQKQALDEFAFHEGSIEEGKEVDVYETVLRNHYNSRR